MKYIKSAFLGIFILIGLTALSITTYAAPIVIDFEDFTTTGPGESNQVIVYNQFQVASKGITFNNPVVLDYSKGVAPWRYQGFAHSGTKAIEQCYSKEFCTKPFEMYFTTSQKRVKLWVGYSESLSKQKTVVMRAFNSSGAKVGQTTAMFQPSETPIIIQTPMEIISDSSNIDKVTVSFLPETYGESTTNDLSIDDIEFTSSEDSSTNNEFPYPRGTIAPYGYCACVNGKCMSDHATLIHFGFSSSTNPKIFSDRVNFAKKLGISKYLMATGGPEMSNESFWREVKDKGITDNDFMGVYFCDEPRPKDAPKIIAMRTGMKKYFPNAVAGDYLADMSEGSRKELIPGLDVAFFTTYTKFHPERPHAWVYGNLIVNGPDWKNAGKTIWSTTEAFRDACNVSDSDPDLSTAQKVADRHTSQIVMGILGGAQGVFSYAPKETKGTPCDTGWVSFKPRYEQVWPWIMEGNRKLLTTQVTSGRRNITTSKPSSTIDAVTAYIFTDKKGRKLIASSSMLDFTEANGMANNAIISGVPNGTYEVLWENRTLTITNGTIKDTWRPYEYHFYQLKTNDAAPN
jgi:hypothetical protein